MRLIPHSFNGFYFQQKNRVASGWGTPYDWTIAGISTNAIARSQNFPSHAVKNYAGSLKFIKVTFNSIDTDRDSLVIAGDVLGEDQHQLIALDELGRAWYLNAIYLGMTEEAVDDKTASFNVVFDTDDPIWKKLVPSTLVMTTLYGEASGTATPLGNQPALPVITITTTEVGLYGFTYKRFVTITNNSLNALNNYPLDLTGGGLNTAALVSAGKMLANGDDLRIYVDGVEVKRWFGGGGIDSATTTIWINHNQMAKSDLTLGANIAASGEVEYITIENTAANMAILPNIPVSSKVIIGSEIFVYTGVDVELRRLTGITRGERSTSEGAHTTGDAVKFVDHDIWMYYGNSTIAPYVVDDTYKPIIDLVNSANDVHVYTEFGSDEGTRTASWTKTARQPTGNLYSVYFGFHSGLATSPWEVIGIYGSTNWVLYNPCGFDSIEVEGAKHYTGQFTWDLQVQSSVNGTIYVLLWSETAPSLSAWYDLDVHSQAISAPYPSYLRIQGFPGSGSHRYEAGGITVGVPDATRPTITLSSENSVTFTLNSVLTNNANGYTMELEIPIDPGAVLIIDTGAKTIKFSDGSNQINALINMPIRAEWFPFVPGRANEIEIDEAGIVVYSFSWEDRSL